MVDYVSDESEIAGKSAADFAKNQLNCGKTVNTLPAFGVRYVLPQTVNLNSNEDVSLFMRVTAPFGKVRFTVKSGENILATAVRLKAAPGEMEKITVKAEKLKDVTKGITVSLEEL